MIGGITLIENEVASALRGARIVGLIQTGRISSRSDGEEYIEDTFMVAWQREDQCGTHQANVNSSEQVALFHGHYDFNTTTDALNDMLMRANVDCEGQVPERAI